MVKLNTLQFLPVILAIIGIISSGFNINNSKTKLDFIISILSVVGAMLLIFAQTSWWEAAVINGNLQDTWFANQIWLIFNTIMMVLIILISRARK